MTATSTKPDMREIVAESNDHHTMRFIGLFAARVWAHSHRTEVRLHTTDGELVETVNEGK